ncbi:MAG: GerW family sporulation protein [Clostridia bacterium]|nr:GerW family sporulation protein [Clostridia bacterium]
MEIKKPVENVLDQTLKNLKTIVDVDCIVGNPINYNDTTIIPISKISVGFIGGGGEYDTKKKKSNNLNMPFAGGSGGGCNLTPIGFLVVMKEKVEFLKVDNESNIEKIINLANGLLSSFK